MIPLLALSVYAELYFAIIVYVFGVRPFTHLNTAMTCCIVSYLKAERHTLCFYEFEGDSYINK